LDHVTPYDRFAWTDSQIEQLLAAGQHERELIAYFGETEYRELVALAREAAKISLDAAPRAVVVPGIMGSQLGVRRAAPLPNDILWLDPIDIELGRLSLLRVPEAAAANPSPVVSLGAVLFSYLRLKLHLRVAGFDAIIHDYDWRLGIDELGRGLATRLSAEVAASPASTRPVVVVAHSMGGLVTRAALTQPGLEGISRVILMGSPNFGSYAPVQALRGTYAVVRKIARLVQNHSAESMAAEIFNTFPSLYHMLPVASRHGGPDLFDPAEWPTAGPRPRPQMLAAAQSVGKTLAQPDSRFSVIVGVDQETVTAITRRSNDFIYTVTRHGDGTVPAVSAELPGATNYYAAAAHSDLTRDPEVAAAVVDLLRTGTTARLSRSWKGKSRAEARVSDRQLRRTHAQKVDWASLEPEERRLFLQNLNEPPQLRLRVPSAARARAAHKSPAGSTPHPGAFRRHKAK
jgi:pimeloyl-ACP methyl ester carboxylesterase